MWRNDITCLPNCRSMSASVMLDTIRPLCISWSSSISSIARRNDNGIFFINKNRTIRHQYCAHSHYRQVFPSLPQHSSLINTTHTRFQTNAMHYTHAPNTTHSCACVCLCVEFGVVVARDTTVSCYSFCQYLFSEFTPINANKSVPYLYTIYYTIQCLINDRITHVVASTAAWFTWQPDMKKKHCRAPLYDSSDQCWRSRIARCTAPAHVSSLGAYLCIFCNANQTRCASSSKKFAVKRARMQVLIALKSTKLGINNNKKRGSLFHRVITFCWQFHPKLDRRTSTHNAHTRMSSDDYHDPRAALLIRRNYTCVSIYTCYKAKQRRESRCVYSLSRLWPVTFADTHIRRVIVLIIWNWTLNVCICNRFGQCCTKHCIKSQFRPKCSGQGYTDASTQIVQLHKRQSATLITLHTHTNTRRPRAPHVTHMHTAQFSENHSTRSNTHTHTRADCVCNFIHSRDDQLIPVR